MKNEVKCAWERPWLVQRLREPDRFDNPFSFGGGLRNGGLTQEAFDIFKQIWSWDYMGAAEFEFGAIPACLKKMLTASIEGRLGAHVFTIKVSPRLKEDSYQRNYKKKIKVQIYVICNKDHVKNVNETIKLMVNDKIRLKEISCIYDAIFPRSFDFKKFIGGIELNNGWFYFTNPETFKKVCQLFEVKMENENEMPKL